MYQYKQINHDVTIYRFVSNASGTNINNKAVINQTSSELDVVTHGKLGKKYPRPIPFCAIKEIRKAFPSEFGEYKGFEYAHHDM